MLTIIGCGNPNRRDDGAGVVVVQRLQASLGNGLPPDVRIFDAGTAGMDVMFQARGSRALILVDACRSGSEPGAVFEVPGEELAACPAPSYNLHDFRWDHALFAGRQIYGDDFPEDVSVYLIEAASLELGIGLSPEVEQAVEKVVGRLAERIGAWRDDD